MTETAERTGTRVRTIRMFDDAWTLIGTRSRDASTFIRDMTDAGLGFARCYRCFEMVPVEFGDLTGKPLAEWVAEAGKVATAQHREGHHPVTVGNAAEWADAAAAEIFGDTEALAAKGRKPPAGQATPGSAVFREPGGKPVLAAAVPQVPASRSRKGRR